MYQKSPKPNLYGYLWKVNISTRLHRLMKEITRRKRPETGYTTGRQYYEAITQYLRGKEIPRQVERIDRSNIRLQMPEDFAEKVEALRWIAVKREQPLPVLVEEALEEYLARPENYLGKTVYAKHQRKMLKVTKKENGK